MWDASQTGKAALIVGNALVFDGFTTFFAVLVSSAVVLSALISDSYLRREGLDGPEFYVLALLSASGAMIMAAANDLIVVFLGLEILSLALYVMAAYHRRRAESGEASMKYFILGAFSSAIFLYGVALCYGATGSTRLSEIAIFLAKNHVPKSILLAGVVLVIVGLGFKVAAVPFHTWTPDVYQGSPTPATGFMAAVAKAGGFAALIRVLMSALPDPAGRLAARHLGPGRPDAAGGFGAGHRPDRRETDAGLLVDQPRRLRAGGAAGRPPRRGWRGRCSTCCRMCSWCWAASPSCRW